MRTFTVWIPLLLHLSGCCSDVVSVGNKAEAKAALDYVHRTTATNCSAGTNNILPVEFNYELWQILIEPAVKTANYLSMLLAENKLNVLNDDMFYAMVRSNIHGYSIVYGSAIGLEPGVYHNRERFCPYSCKKKNVVVAFDITEQYDYLSNTTIWYTWMRKGDFSNVSIKEDKISFNSSDPYQVVRQPVATYNDGQWSFPYFDCGGGDIWMVTYSAPILEIGPAGLPVFLGVSTIDVELTHVDINQCDVHSVDNDNILNIFHGTHSCQPTTLCVDIAGLGFKRGAYICQCRNGYYFPNTTASLKFYNGTDLETYSDLNRSDIADHFKCLPCARGCARCVDDSPCILEQNVTVRLLIVVVALLMILGCCCASFIVFKYRYEKIMKTASPLFLHIMCLGAVIMCLQIFVLYPEVTTELCIAEIWTFHLGFSLLYGALNIKTWRIAIIFTVGMTKKVHVSDKRLSVRLLQMVACVVVYLACWTAVSPPRVRQIWLTDKLKFYMCQPTKWTYVLYGAEGLFLLYGVYLCFVVRKAPVFFNESKHITIATYNAIIIGNFIIILTEALAMRTGPDILYFMKLSLLQAIVTLTMVLIFGNKLWGVFHRAYLLRWSITDYRSSDQKLTYPVIICNMATQTETGNTDTQPHTKEGEPETANSGCAELCTTDGYL